MKRRKRKPKTKQSLSKLADQAKVRAEVQNEAQSEVHNGANPPATQAAIDRSASYVELQDELETHTSSAETQTMEAEQIPQATPEPEEPPTPSRAGAKPLVPSQPPPAAADRRSNPRYAFSAVAEVVATESRVRTKTRVRDLSQHGCFLDTESPLPLGVAVDLSMTKGANSLQAKARIVYTQPGKGMGLMFTVIEPPHRATLDSWISESRETSWLAANRRRSQRVLMKIPVRLSAQTGVPPLEEEDTHTLAVSAHGALIVFSAPVFRGQQLSLSNVQTKGALECVVAHIEKIPGQPKKVGVEFLLPNPTFWHVAFPPKDWTPSHPHAKSRPKR